MGWSTSAAQPGCAQCPPSARAARRGVLSVCSLLALALLVVAGCTNAPPPPLVSSTPPTTTPPPKPPGPTEVVFGVDTLTGGFNPHTSSDQSPTTTALAQVTLPSVFRPGQDGKPAPDGTLVRSAEVTGTEPFTVTYQLRTDASWSDGVPIAAEDFDYLFQQMRSQPGVVNPAGYRLISKVSSRDGGKVVEVTFSKPYPGWQSLFDNLLPAHLLRDAPNGWQNGMSDGMPASAGPYSVRSIDRDRGEALLERNDRYWDKPGLLDRIVLRKADHSGLVDALRTNADQAALLRADSIAMNLLHELGPPVSVVTVPRPAVAQVLLRPGSPKLADLRVRTALANAVDRESLIATGTGAGPSAQLRADALVRAPSQPGYAATMPTGAPGTRHDPVAVAQLLTEAGYQKTATNWTKDGQPLALVIAAQAGVEPYLSLAEQLRQQFAAVGIPATVTTPTGNQLYGDQLAVTPTAKPENPSSGGTVDIVVGPRTVTADPAADLASNYGCPQPMPESPQPAPATTSGFCDSALQTTIDQALTGTLRIDQALATVEPVLWQQAVVIPLFQLADVLATGPDVRGVAAEAPFVGPLAGAPHWRRGAR